MPQIHGRCRLIIFDLAAAPIEPERSPAIGASRVKEEPGSTCAIFR